MKKVLLWALALILAVIIGRLAGRALARYVVYSRPQRPFIVQIDGCSCKHDGDCERARCKRRERKSAL
jgi:hypothetical protein